MPANLCHSVHLKLKKTDVSKTGCQQHMGYRKGMAIASFNVNGLRSHLDEVKILMKDLGTHILALNETKLATGYPKELTNVAGYHQEGLERTCNGGGVSIYIRDSIKYTPSPDVPANDLEMMCIEVEPPKANPFLSLLCTGHPGTISLLLIS